MSIPAEDADLARLSNGALCKMLNQAELQEREISDRRREIHDLIDASSVSAVATAEIAALSQQEREMSAARLQLHLRILELRLEKSRRIDGLRPSLKIAGLPDV